MKLYARLENKYSENDHVIDEVIRYYTEAEVLNEYWSYWVDRTDSFITKDNCLFDWLKAYQGWIDVSDDDDAETQTYNAAKDAACAMRQRVLDDAANDNMNYTVKNITLQELYINLAASLFDIIQEGAGDSYYFEILSAIARGNIKGIRKAFVDGNSAILVPDILECIEEVRIYDEGKLLMVVVGDEIQY